MAFSKVNARRPHGVHWLNMESMALLGEGGFRHPAKQWSEHFGAARDHGVAAPTQGCASPRNGVAVSWLGHP
jgi:hypothetical protein